MPSATSSESDNEGDIPCDIPEEPTHIESNHLLREYTHRTTDAEQHMISNNDFVRASQSAKEWDEQLNFDGIGEESFFVEANSIPSELSEGMYFHDKRHLIFCLQGWSINNNVEYTTYASNRVKLTVLCIHHNHPNRSCMWRLHASVSKRLGGAWKIAGIAAPHTCSHSILNSGHRQCNSEFINYYIQPVIRQQIDLKPREIIGRIESKFNIRVSYMKAWDARRKAIKAIFGSWEESYRTLEQFMVVLYSVMPGTVYRIQPTDSGRFHRIFWSFGPCIVGWQYCRPVLSLDGTFLLGKYRGTLLTAVGIDANNGLFPLAFAIVESECNESWGWFIQTMQDLLPIISSRADLCIISDRHSGLVRGCRDFLPWAAHRHCLRHLRENFKKACRTMGIADTEFMCQKMYVAGNTDDIHIFMRYMTDIKNIKVEASDWLLARDIAKWSLTHDGGYRYGTMTTNASECFNGVLKRARGLPIQALIMSIYYNLVSIFMKRLAAASELISQQESLFTPRVKRMLQQNEREARRCPEPIRISVNEFQVFGSASRSYKVEMQADATCSCTCRHPQLYHIPCPHVIAVLAQRHASHVQHVSGYYTLQMYHNTYSDEFHVIPDRSEWSPYLSNRELVELAPPNIRRRSGRPRTVRYKNTIDENAHRSNRICGLCKNVGHNRATCPQNPHNPRRMSFS